ncbi:MAG TPA: hypothetical protein VK171_14490 [Fimbriimonas sp.]|nr:hypothetical protein [Fimbriimonas sp.]
MKLIRSLRALRCAGLVAVVAVALACGGAGSALISAFLGNYSGTGTLHSGKVGNLTYTVKADGQVSGTFVVSGVESAFAGFNFALGSYDLQGLIDALGQLHLRGNVPGQGDFDINGTASSTGSTSGYTVTAGSDSYTGTMSKDSGATTDIVRFSALTGTNCPGVNFLSSSFTTIYNDAGWLTLILKDTETATNRLLEINLNSTYATGTSAILAGTINPDAQITYQETIGGKVCAWIAKSGTAKVISRTSTSAEIELVDVFFGTAATPGSATGTFVLDGTVKK